MQSTEKPFICLLTDFGLYWGAVSCMHGVIASIDPRLPVHDVCHLLPPFKPWEASFCLHYTVPCWPAGTIFVSVVDPGVGTSRRASIARTGTGHYIVSPDNGTLTHIQALQGIEEIRQIDEARNRRPGTEKFNTFHGRDLFAYTAARLAAGCISFEEVGPRYPVEEIVTYALEAPAIGAGWAAGILDSANSHFGNVTTNITIENFESAGFKTGDSIAVTIQEEGQILFNAVVLYHRSFGYVKTGEPIIFNGSTGAISLALNQGNLTGTYGLGAGTGWTIRFSRQTPRLDRTGNEGYM